MKSAVVVVNWNSGERLKACLESLPAGATVVVVDNASTDDSLKQAETSAAKPTFIKNSSNRGLAAAVNQGVAATSSSYILLLNPDVRSVGNSIQTLERILEENPRTGAVGGYVNDKYLPRYLATPWTVIRENCGFPIGVMSTELVEQPAAAALLVRRDAFVGAGGFDERFFPAWYEDVDFCRSLRDKGWEIRFARDAYFIHEGGYSARALGGNFVAAYYRNQLRYIRKHFGVLSSLPVRLSIIAGMAARIIRQPAHAGACSKVIVGAIGGW